MKKYNKEEFNKIISEAYNSGMETKDLTELIMTTLDHTDTMTNLDFLRQILNEIEVRRKDGRWTKEDDDKLNKIK